MHHAVVGMHGVLELGYIRVLGDVVDWRGREAHAALTIFLTVQIKVTVADIERSGAVVGVVVVELIKL